MNLTAAVTVLAFVMTSAAGAAAQGFRGFATGGGSQSGSGQSGAPAGPGRDGTPGLGQFGAPAGPARTGTPRAPSGATPPGAGVTPAPGGFTQSPPQASVPQVSVPRFVPPVVHGGPVPVAPQGTPGFSTGAKPPPPGVAPGPKGQPGGKPPAVTPRVPPSGISGGGFGITQPNPLHRPPGGGGIGNGRRPRWPPPPPHWRPRPPYYRYFRHPGVIFFGSPFFPYAPYYYPYTVITETAPGVLQEERRYVDQPPAGSTPPSGDQMAPFEPMPQEVVDRILWLADVKAGDLLYDLGAGDGRVAIAAAKKYGIKVVGFEIDPSLVKLARENVRKQGVEHLVEIRQEDILTADMSLPSVVTLYLSYEGNLAIRAQLMSRLKPGARVVSYGFDMAEWQPKVSETYRDASGNSHLIYLWEIGGPLVFGDVRP